MKIKIQGTVFDFQDIATGWSDRVILLLSCCWPTSLSYSP